MSHWGRPFPLRDDARAETVRLLSRMAAELSRDDAGAILANIALGADDTHRADASGGIGGGRSGPSSPVESTAFAPGALTERSRQLLDDLHQLAPHLRSVISGWSEWDPNRALELCPICLNPLDRQYTRCQWRDPDTGVQCGSRAGTERRCATCDEVQPPGRWLRNGECDACRRHRRRTGRARVATSMLALGQGLVVEGEAFSDVDAA